VRGLMRNRETVSSVLSNPRPASLARIGATMPIRQLHDLYVEKVRVTITNSLTRNRQGIYFL
jgi:hypothetical protein